MASKFNIDNLNLGEGLLNSEAVALAVDENVYPTTMIPYERLHVADVNQYSIDSDSIDELALSIEDVGLQQSITVVRRDDDDYDILAGQRRYLAIGRLIERGYTKYERVPCHVQSLADVPLNISDKAKRLYITATTNITRDVTDADKLLIVEQLSEVYDEMRREGVERNLPRRRDFIADKMSVSPRQVQDILSVSKNATDETREAVLSGAVKIQSAKEIAALDAETQNDVTDKILDGAAVDDVLAELPKVKEKKSVLPSVQLKVDTLNQILPSLELNDIASILTDNEVIIKGRTKAKIDELIEAELKIRKKLETLLKKELKGYF